VLVAFLTLALALIALQSGGAAIGWGFQLQYPLVSAALALLFFAIGLNLLNVFELTGLENSGGELSSAGGDLGAFFTGALAVVAATPCTAPFMAGAIGIALTQSGASTLVIFAALGIGFAAPLTLISFAPALAKALPKPGDWMERFKKLLAFPMFASAAYLAWVLTRQAGAGAAFALSAIAIALAFALVVSRWSRFWLVIGVIALALTTLVVWRPLSGQASAQALAEEAWSPERVSALRAEGRGVFVNFTADWCVSCKVNEAVALSTPRVALVFAQRHIAYLKGDWTRRDGAIAAELRSRGRPGVPLYLYYAPGRDAVVLPQILSEAAVLAAVDKD
jgi:thiol:disulfide interchange protein DsbD